MRLLNKIFLSNFFFNFRKLGVDQAYENLRTYKAEERTANDVLSDYENSFNKISQDPTMDLVKSTENLIVRKVLQF